MAGCERCVEVECGREGAQARVSAQGYAHIPSCSRIVLTRVLYGQDAFIEGAHGNHTFLAIIMLSCSIRILVRVDYTQTV